MATYNLTVPNKNGSYDGDYVVKQYTSLTINAGNTLTTDQPCRGLMILVQGDCVINGTLSMKARGPSANPTTGGASDGNAVSASGLQLPFYTASGSSTLNASATLFNGCGSDVRSVVANFRSIVGNGDVMSITRTGSGDRTISSAGTGQVNGTTGTSGTNSTGGGGTGSSGYDHNGSRTGMKGRSGTCFGGGSGGGGLNGSNGGLVFSDLDAQAYGGRGGHGWAGHTSWCTGGAGNPTGDSPLVNQNGSGGAVTSSNGETGTGGVIWLIVGGNLTIGSGGLITVQGSRSDGIDGNGYNWLSTGGGSGAGVVKIAHRGTYTNNGTINTAGGLAGTWFDGGNGQYCSNGGNGGGGHAQVLSVL